MSGAGGMVSDIYSQLPANIGGGGSFPGQQTAQTMPAEGGVGGQYGQLGSYNTLAQDLAAGQTGRFQPLGQNPFAYQAAQGPGGRPGVSGYTGIGPFQNQGGGQIPQWMQTAQPFSQQPFRGRGATGAGWPSFGYGGATHHALPYQGSRYGGLFGGSGFGGYGFPSFPYGGGPGSYQSPGSMPFGGGRGFGMSDYFPRQTGRMGGWPPQFGGGGGMTAGGSPAGTYGGFAPPLGQQQGTYTNPVRSVRPAQEVEQFRNYRSPFAGGGMFTQYNPGMMIA